MGAFTPARLTLARMRRGLNKTELAEAARLTPRSITEYEAGRTVPSAATIAVLASVLRFPPQFFELPEPKVPSEEAVSFRSLTSMKAAQRDSAIGAGALAFELQCWIDARFNLPASDVPDLRGLEPADAAAALRERWGLGVLPIKSTVHLLELHGVRVFSLTEQAREVDAFSAWQEGTPFCFLNTMKSVEHGRFDAAHELGHLVLHRHGHPKGREAETEANAFASAFLMPQSTIRARVPRGATVRRLIELKSEWGVSVAALAHRSHQVEVLSDWQYRGICIELGRLGYRTREPAAIPNRETSQVLQKVFASLRDDRVSKSEVARQLRMAVADLDSIVFGLVLTAVDGNSVRPTGLARDVPPNLKLVTQDDRW